MTHSHEVPWPPRNTLYGSSHVLEVTSTLSTARSFGQWCSPCGADKSIALMPAPAQDQIAAPCLNGPCVRLAAETAVMEPYCSPQQSPRKSPRKAAKLQPSWQGRFPVASGGLVTFTVAAAHSFQIRLSSAGKLLPVCHLLCPLRIHQLKLKSSQCNRFVSCATDNSAHHENLLHPENCNGSPSLRHV